MTRILPRLRNKSAAVLAALIVASSSLLAQPAQAQTVEWRGYFNLGAFSPECEQNGWFERDMISGNARYRPSGLGSNGPNTRLSLIAPFHAYNFTAAGRRFDGTFRPVASVAVAGSGWTNTGTRLRVSAHQPGNNNLNADTLQIRLHGHLRNFEGLSGCSAEFEVTLLPRRR